MKKRSLAKELKVPLSASRFGLLIAALIGAASYIISALIFIIIRMFSVDYENIIVLVLFPVLYLVAFIISLRIIRIRHKIKNKQSHGILLSSLGVFYLMAHIATAILSFFLIEVALRITIDLEIPLALIMQSLGLAPAISLFLYLELILIRWPNILDSA